MRQGFTPARVFTTRPSRRTNTKSRSNFMNHVCTAFEGAIDTVRRGGTVVVLGVYSSETTELQLGAYWSRALTLRFAGLTPVVSWWRRAMGELARGTVDPTPLISHRLPLEAAAEGYALFDRREATKVVLEP